MSRQPIGPNAARQNSPVEVISKPWRSMMIVGAGFATPFNMASGDHRWTKIRDLIEEMDRVRGESERMRGHADRAMKSSFWPERRRSPRFPPRDEPHTEHHNDA